MRSPDIRRAWSGVRWPAAVLAAVLAGCASGPPAGPRAVPPAPPLQLVAAGDLELSRACEPHAGAVYRVSYVVQRDGRVAQVESGSEPGCVQDALRAWVGTFEYYPPGASVSTTLDWLGVTAARLR